jgi:hypothetical protein
MVSQEVSILDDIFLPLGVMRRRRRKANFRSNSSSSRSIDFITNDILLVTTTILTVQIGKVHQGMRQLLFHLGGTAAGGIEYLYITNIG